MVCSLCRTRYAMEKDLPYCESCWSVLEEGGIPPVDFRAYFSEGLEEKLIAVDSLLFNNPDHFFLWYLKGTLEHELGSVKRALRSINTSISYKDDFGDAWIRLGLIYSDMHRDAEAVEHFERGLKYPLIDPTNLVDAGASLQASGNPRLSSRILLRALDLVPDDDRTLLTLGKVLIQLDDVAEARKVLEKGLAKYPHNEEMLRAMAQLMLKREDLTSAMEMYERILDQHPRDFEALLAMGEIQLKTGELGKSIKYYKEVRELDLHISWSGVLKFIMGHLKEVLQRNRNMPSYRETLQKEYENTLSFTKGLEAKVETSPGPDLISEMETLMKMFENQRTYLREQLKQAQDLVASAKVNDSFHQHLTSKVADLDVCIGQKRYFDAKELALELSPFITDLKEVDHAKVQRFKDAIQKRLSEMAEFGFPGFEIRERLKEAEALEAERKMGSAMFILKEIEVSLLEHWAEIGEAFRSERLSEMRKLIDDSKGKFELSALTRKMESYARLKDPGPKDLLAGYQEFMTIYQHESENHFNRETDRVLQELKYKLLLLEKDGANVAAHLAKVKDLKDRKAGMSAHASYNEASKLMMEMDGLESEHNAANVKRKLARIGSLMSDLKAVGLDEDMGPHILPVRDIIERSISGGNVGLADILSAELFNNVEKLLYANFIERLRDRSKEAEGVVLRLKGLGVERSAFFDLSRSAKESLAYPAEGKMIEALDNVTALLGALSSFMEGPIGTEIDKKMDQCKTLIGECEAYKINCTDEKREVEKFLDTPRMALSVDDLEDAFRLEKGIERKMKEGLGARIEGQNRSIKKRVSDLSSRGADSRRIVDTLTLVNRSEVLMESGQFRQAFEISQQAARSLEKVEQQTARANLQKKLQGIGSIFERAKELEIDMMGLPAEMAELPEPTSENFETVRDSVDSLNDRARLLFFDGAEKLHSMVLSSYDSLSRGRAEAIPADLREFHSENTRRLKDALDKRDADALYPLFTKCAEALQAIREWLRGRELIERCSTILDLGFDPKDEVAKEILARAQDISKRVQSGNLERAEEDLRVLEKEVGSILSIMKMSKIEELLRLIGELDDFALEVFAYIEGEHFQERKDEILDEIDKMMDVTSSLYDSHDLEDADSLLEKVNELKAGIMSLDGEWRADKRYELVREIDAIVPSPLKRPLRAEMEKVKESYKARDWNMFFSLFDRFEEKLKDVDWKGRAPAKIAAKLSDEAPQVPPEPPLPVIKPRTGPRLQGGLGGIGRIASEAFSKHMKMEVGEERPAETAPVPTSHVKEPAARTQEDRTLSGIAKLIAGSRIEALRKAEEEEGQVKDVMDDFIILDASAQSSSTAEDTERLRAKLDSIFARMPKLAQLEEARSRYAEGCADLAEGRSSKALREFKVAITSAVKICRLDADIRKAVQKLKIKIDSERSRGKDVSSVQAMYDRALEKYRSGNLEETPRLIREVAEELKRMR